MKPIRDMTDDEIAFELKRLRHVGGQIRPECTNDLRFVADRQRELFDEQDRRTEAQFAADQEDSREHTPDYE